MIYNCKYCNKNKMWRIQCRQGEKVSIVQYVKKESQANKLCWEMNTQARMFG